MNLINPDEVEFNAIRAQGPGGQNVNKVACAVHLRFDIARSSLEEAIKVRLLASRDQRINKEGVIILKAQQSRSQEQNRIEGLQRLQAIIDKAALLPSIRRATRPTRSSQRQRLDRKNLRGMQKVLRGKVQEN